MTESRTTTSRSPDRDSLAAAAPTILAVEHLTRSYASGAGELTVLRDVSFGLAAGETCAIVGPSGSGKTTLLGLCAGLDRPSSGQVRLDGVDLGGLDEDGLARLRLDRVGFVFQGFRLIPTLTALENVMVPVELAGRRDAADAARTWLERVGLGERTDHRPQQLSGGEQQRVALARAFVNDPRILFADEPIGNLDADTGRRVADLLFELNATHDATLVVVTHDESLAVRAGRRLAIRGGELVSDERTGAATHAGRAGPAA